METSFDKLLFREDVLKALRTNATFSESVRSRALALAERYSLNPNRVNEASWAIVRLPGKAPAAYLRALYIAEAACRLDPENGLYLNTLGVAQCRAGRYQEAVATLTRSDSINSRKMGLGQLPADLAFLAMAQFRLGELEKAQVVMGRLNEATKSSAWANDSESQGFLREAEMIGLDLVFPADPFALECEPGSGEDRHCDAGRIPLVDQEGSHNPSIAY